MLWPKSDTLFKEMIRTNCNRLVDPEPVPVVSVIIAVYNEVRTVGSLVERVMSVPPDPMQAVVDDGSTDGTYSELRRLREPYRIRVVRHARNRGKGATIRTGLAEAQGAIVLIEDADCEYSPIDYPALLNPLLVGNAGAVYGSRYLWQEGALHRPWWARTGVVALNLCVRLLYGVRLTDEATSYKAFPVDVLRVIELNRKRFEFCPEVAAKAMRMGLRIVEVPVRYTPRTRKEGRRVRLRVDLVAVWTLWRWRHWDARVVVRPRQKARNRRPRALRAKGLPPQNSCHALIKRTHGELEGRTLGSRPSRSQRAGAKFAESGVAYRGGAWTRRGECPGIGNLPACGGCALV